MARASSITIDASRPRGAVGLAAAAGTSADGTSVAIPQGVRTRFVVPSGNFGANPGLACAYDQPVGVSRPHVCLCREFVVVKVVLFCGGQGLRLRDHSEFLPKPMVIVGYRPILWHVMRYYAHFGHKEFILCLGYKADAIKNYFLHYEETLSNDFVLSGESGTVELLQRDIADWRITFLDTGLGANVGQRLRAVRKHVGDEPFLANYGDVLTDAPLDERVDRFIAGDDIASFLCVRPTSYSFHLVRLGGSNVVTRIDDVGTSDLWINGGYFIFQPEIFDYIGPGEELVQEPFARLIGAGKLRGDPYEGYWAPMDTLKDVQALQNAFDSGRPPWAVWQTGE